jgi:hypothetical protein
MNRFEAIKQYYAAREKRIMSTPQNEWALDPYEWEEVVQMTPIEAWLWGDIREANAVFYPQWPVGGVFVDFGNPVAKVAIECDGAAYHNAEKDAARDAKLAAIGWRVFRISGRACRTECDSETGEPGYARQFVEAVVRAYGLKRRGFKSSGFEHGFYGCLPMIDRLMEQNQ